MRTNVGKTESRVAEIFVPIDRADQADEAKRSADRIIEQLQARRAVRRRRPAILPGRDGAGRRRARLGPARLARSGPRRARSRRLPVRQYSEPDPQHRRLAYPVRHRPPPVRRDAARRHAPQPDADDLAAADQRLGGRSRPGDRRRAEGDGRRRAPAATCMPGRATSRAPPPATCRASGSAISRPTARCSRRFPSWTSGGTAGPFRVAEGLQVVSLCGKVGGERPADPRCHFPADPAAEARGGRPALHARPAAPGDHRRQAAMTAAAPLAVTMGEPAGIGGELSLKAWSMRQRGARPFFVLDDAARLAAPRRQARPQRAGARDRRARRRRRSLRDGAARAAGAAARACAGRPARPGQRAGHPRVHRARRRSWRSPARSPAW